MKHRPIKLLISFMAVIVLFANALPVKARDKQERQFKILYISSYEYSNASVPPQLEGFEKGLEGINVEINYEFMDAEKYYGAQDIQTFDKYLRYKFFSQVKYDLLMVADDPALRYAINNRNDMFADIPMVFMGVNSKTEAVTAAAIKNSTGIAESLDFEANYNLMRALFPKRNKVNVIIDASVAGQGDYVEFMKFKELHPELKSNIINTSYYTAEGLKELFESLGSEDVLLFLDFTVDGERNSYSLQNASEFITNYAPDVPVFRVASADIGHGVLGGISYSYYESGVIAGDIAKQILLGKSPDDIPLVVDRLTSPVFEQGAMDRFGVKYSKLPFGSTIINEHRNLARFYRENKVISNLTIVIAILLVAIIFLLFMTARRRKKAIRTDFLTQLPNRKKLMEDIAQLIKDGSSYGIIMLDVDYFKDINDTYGHKVGDEVICEMGNRLKALSESGLSFARLGGDEFCGIFTSTGKLKGELICKDIIKCIKKDFKTSAGRLKVTVSIGCAMYPVDTSEIDTVMECADKALYVTKEKGRNGYTLFGNVNLTS